MNEKVIFRVVFDNFPNVYILMERVGTGEHWGEARDEFMNK